MIFIFYYIYNNLNNSYIIVSHHEAERIVNVTSGLSSSTIKVENTCISSIVIVTAAHQPKEIKGFSSFSNLKLTQIIK